MKVLVRGPALTRAFWHNHSICHDFQGGFGFFLHFSETDTGHHQVRGEGVSQVMWLFFEPDVDD